MRRLFSHIPRLARLSPFTQPQVYVSRSPHPSVKKLARKLDSRVTTDAAKMDQKLDYKSWSQEKLIERVTQLELELKNKNLRSSLVNYHPGGPLLI